MTSTSGLCGNKDTEPCCSSEVESMSENGTDKSNSSRENNELSTTVLSDAEQLSSAVDSSSRVSTCSQAEENNHVPSDTCYICSSSSSSSSSSQPEELGSIPYSTESSSILESPSEVFLPTETSSETLPPETKTNVFFQEEKVPISNFQVCEIPVNATELDTNVPSPAERENWILMERKFIQKEGYRLGVKPGTFYSSTKGYFVEMPNGTNYEIILTNENPVPCNVEVFIDNRPMPAICFKLKPDKPMKFDGPTYCENKFVFLRSKDAPLRSGISAENWSNGVIEAVFTPQKVESVRSRTVSEPIPFSRNVNSALQILGIETNTRKLRSYTTSSASAERGIDLTNFCQGATALRGEQDPKSFKRAESIETDETRRVILRLRLITRTDEPTVPSEEDICSLCPPLVEELLES